MRAITSIRSGLAGAAALALLGAGAFADTLRVPSEDYPKIQDAVNAAGEGDVVVIAEGTYTQSVSVGPVEESTRPGFTIRGSGRVVFDGIGIQAYNTDGLRIQNIVILDAAGAGIYADSCPNLFISRMIIRRCDGDGIELQYCDDSTIRNCRITGADGASISDYSSDNLVIDRCILKGFDGSGVPFANGNTDGIDLSPYTYSGNGSDGARVTRNRITNVQTGVRASGADIQVRMNVVSDFNYAGVYIEGNSTNSNARVYSYYGGANSDRAIVRGNLLVTENGGSYGVYVYANEASIGGNYVGDGLSSGIYNNGNDADIYDNAIEGGGWGIESYGSGNNVFRNVMRYTGAGIYVGDGSDCAVYRNTVRDSGEVGINVDVYSSDIRANFIMRTGGDGIYVSNSSNTFRRNTSLGSGDFDLYDQYSAGSNVYSQNLFGTTYFNQNE